MIIRFSTKAELTRGDGDKEDKNIITGFGLEWNEVLDLGYMEEQFEKGAFPEDTRTDTKMLVAHQPGIPLGNVRAKTMSLSESDKGLRFKVKLSDNSTRANDILDAVERGDLTDVSIGFTLRYGGEYKWVEPKKGSKGKTRLVILKVGLLREISFVDMGAYTTAKIDKEVQELYNNRTHIYRYDPPKTDETYELFRQYQAKKELDDFNELLKREGL